MDERQKYILESAIEMREFNARNAADYTAYTEAAAQFTVINDRIEDLQNHASAQTSGRRSQAVEQKAVLREAIRRKMRDISRTARALDLADEGFRRLFAVPFNSADQKLLASAREFAAQAETHKQDFLRLAMPEDFVDALNEDIADFEIATGEKADAHGETVGATAAMDSVTESVTQAARILDAIMKNVYRNNAQKLAEWTQARHVRRSARRKPEPPPENK